MIDQLMQRQDVEDRKRLLMMGADKPQTVWQDGKGPRRAKSTLKQRVDAPTVAKKDKATRTDAAPTPATPIKPTEKEKPE